MNHSRREFIGSVAGAAGMVIFSKPAFANSFV